MEKKVIELYPDSGHHYVALSLLPGAELPEQVKEICDQDTDPWKEYEKRPYVRWRLGFQQKKLEPRQRVIWCVIETNTGDNKRGAILETIPPTETAPPGKVAPYFSHDAKDRLQFDVHFTFDEGQSPFQTLRVKWPQELGKPYDVDLVIDFGNSRTSAVLIETPQQSGPGPAPNLSDILKPVVFAPRRCEPEPLSYNPKDYGDLMVAESWFVLQQPTFAQFEPPHLKRENAMLEEVSIPVTTGWGPFKKTEEKIVERRYRIAQTFVELSPTVMGQEAARLLSYFKFERDGCVFLSSPKRYAWDHSPRNNPFWVMSPNRWDHHDEDANVKLAAQVLRFMRTKSSPDENLIEDWDINNPPYVHEDAAKRAWPNPAEPSHCRADSIVWAALNVIEMARRQYSSMEFRKGNAPLAQRHLRSITVTYPPGWTNADKALYKRKWQTAVNIFTIAHLGDTDGQDAPPLLYMDVDEAFASQFPIIYGEIMRMGGIGENWIELVGRGVGPEARVRVLSIDIGGGTTDYSIIEYRDSLEGQGVDLHPALLFKDSSSIAGDNLVKSVIEKVVLPGLLQGLDSEDRDGFSRLFNGPKNGTVDKEKWKRIVRQMLIPKAIQMLSELVTHPETPVNHNNDSTGAAMWEAGPLLDLNEFAAAAGFAPPIAIRSGTLVPYAVADLHECIRETFRNLVDSLAKFVAVFEVDLVVASGKPTELPEVKLLLEKALPLLPNRIIHAKGYPIGSWYPFRDAGNRIFDAKTVAVAGAALYRLILAGKVDGWHIKPDEGRMLARESIWVQQTDNRHGQSPYLRRGEAEKEVSIKIGSRIGRKILDSQRPEPVYILEWANPDLVGKITVKVKLRRVKRSIGEVKESHGAKSKPATYEALELIAASGTAKDKQNREVAVGLEDVRLSRCTLESSCYWMDDPNFQMVWPAAAIIAQL